MHSRRVQSELRGPVSARATAADVAEKALERDYFMTASDAVEFGIVDRIVERRAKDEPEQDGSESSAKPPAGEAQEGDGQQPGK